MRVLLIHPEIRTTEPAAHAPYGILQLAALTDSYGAKVACLDNNAFRLPIDAVRQTIKEERWDIIGISSLVTQYKTVKPIVKVCREENPDAVIVGGGGLFSSLPFETLRWLPEFNIAVIGEGYITWQEIMEHIDDKNWKRIKGLVYREGKKIKLSPMRPLIEDYYYCEEHKEKKLTFDEALKNDFQCSACKQPLLNNLDEEVPFPAYEFSPIETYLMNSRIPYSPEAMHPACRRLDVLTSLGCSWHCSFCFHPSAGTTIYGKEFAGKPFRQHSPQYVVNLISHLRQQYCINFVSFIDENLTINRRWFFKFCELLEESGLATLIHWGMVCHTKTVDAELLQKGKDCGLSYISYGGETSSEKLLKEMGKGQTKESMTAAIEATQAAGINPIMSFIIGFPNTTMDDLIDDLQYYIDNQIHVAPFFVQPYPATELYRQHKDKIIEQWLTDEEKMMIRERQNYATSRALAEVDDIKNCALERWVLSLDDATKLSVNLTDFNDVELAGLRYLLSTDTPSLDSKVWDIERLKKFKKSKEDKNERNPL